jgi:Fe-S cluster assembly protein SufD
VLAFTPDAVRASEPPDVEARLEAIQRAAAAPMPTPDDEVWRYSRISDLDLDRHRPGHAVTTIDAGDDVSVVRGGPLGDAFVTTEAVDLFHELNNAFADTVVVSIRAGRAASQAVVITHHLDEADVACFPRLIIDAAPDSEITVVEQFLSPDGLVALCVPRLEVHAAQAARVRYLGVNMLGTSTWLLGHQRAIGERDSNTLLATVALGGDYARMRTEARLSGQGGTTRQIALYYADGDQMHDFRTLQDHAAPKTNSDLLFKGAVQDRAKSVYTGLIKIRKDAKGSAAFQTNRNLTLSAGAWAESVPNLEIETNDVKCSHASTVGPVDEEQRFYLESRGIRPEIAERLVVLGFFDEVLDQLPVGPLASSLRSQVSAKLQRRTP